MDFSSRPQKQFHAPEKPFFVPESKNIDQIEKAEKILNIKKRVTGFVDISRVKGRDEHLIFNFTEDQKKELKRL